MSLDHADDLGPWEGADLQRTAASHTGAGADEGLDDEARFMSGVAKLVRRRMAKDTERTDPVAPAVFLLHATEPATPGLALRRFPMLNNGAERVAGRLWLVGPVVVWGRSLELPTHDDDEVFRLVTDTLRLGEVPAIVYDPRGSANHARFYDKGLSDPDSYTEIEVVGRDISLPEVIEVIDRLHRACLVTPEAQNQAGRLWKDGSRFWAAREAEATIQMYLRAGLVTAFPTCTVRFEQTAVPGRLDLEIEEADPLDSSRITRHAVLELKVLRSFRSSGAAVSDTETDEWVTAGVEQAAAYRAERGARASALCCFDMRKEDSGDACFAHVRDHATRLEVVLRVWFVYSTSERYRAACARN